MIRISSCSICLLFHLFLKSDLMSF
uniref:Uncharacterized protein n=1 Tax=Arundo donax TaxID=35708 RepID=A0A0A9TQ05_ARUDO